MDLFRYSKNALRYAHRTGNTGLRRNRQGFPRKIFEKFSPEDFMQPQPEAYGCA
jgi:hypothetical protein